MVRTMNTEMSSTNILPTLTKITFRPHSTHYFSFTAVVHEGCDGGGVSFGQLAKLIESIGHIGKIDDFTIKPLQQHSFLLTGFSWHTSSQLSSSGTIQPTTAKADPILYNAPSTILQHGRIVDTSTLTRQGVSQQAAMMTVV